MPIAVIVALTNNKHKQGICYDLVIVSKISCREVAIHEVQDTYQCHKTGEGQI